MKIIVSGKSKPKKTYNCSCFECDCIFEFSEEEASVRYDHHNVCLVVNCPECNYTNWISV